ncbi:RluA family pseudouridine synthase [bacterium]|nr:RluA family pseudouridine synthase [bacterium]
MRSLSRRPPPPLVILYRDESVVAVDKPAGVPSTPTRDLARASALSLLRSKLALAKADFLEAPHRLDRDTSGVLLFARDARALAALSESFREGAARKAYVALVHGTVEREAWRIESFLSPGKKTKGRDETWRSVRAGGKKAITDVRVLGRGRKTTLVECAPLTGRTHQIRVHLSEAGHPIVGDELYGAPAGEHARLGRHFLHARRLDVPHPTRAGETLTVESRVPGEFSSRQVR